MSLALWVLLVTLLASCGTETLVKWAEGDAGVDAVGGEIEFGSQEVEPFINPKPDHYKPEGHRYEIVLLHDTTQPYELYVGDHQPIRAKVIDYAIGGPAVGYPVEYTIAGSNPECKDSPPCARFLVKEGMTDSQGIVSVTFEAGEQGDVLYTAELTGDLAIPATMDLHVKNPPVGTLRVHLAYDGPVGIKQINVRVLGGFKSCTNFNPITPWKENLVGEKVAGTVDSTLTFPGLPVAETYTIFATAQKIDTGHLAASGCTDAVHVVPDEQGETDVTLNLYVLTLNPAGTYDTVNHFDFTGAIPGQAGEIVNFVVNLFYDPGQIIIDLVKELVSQYIGEWVTDAAFSLFEDALAQIVTDWLLNNSPTFVQKFFEAGQDLVQIVKHVELTSELKISKLSSDYYFQGIQTWLGINLYWKWNCNKEDPNFDECGKYPFSLKDLEGDYIPMDLITGQFTGMVANYDNLIIDTHKIYLNYGKLILFVLNNMIIPSVTGFDSLEALLYSVIDCNAVANGFMGSVLDGIGIDKAKVEDFCLTAVSFMISPVEELISGLSLDSRLRVHGKCRMLDETDDLLVDKLVEGLWWGHVEVGSEEGAEFEGDFEAVKAKYPGK